MSREPPYTAPVRRADTSITFAWTARDYADALEAQGTTTRLVLTEGVGHEWAATAPSEVVAWFDGDR